MTGLATVKSLKYDDGEMVNAFRPKDTHKSLTQLVRSSTYITGYDMGGKIQAASD